MDVLVALDPLAWYTANASRLVSSYDQVDAESLYSWMMDLIPSGGGLAVEIGAGSGRDARMWARRGFDVLAVEPCRALWPVGDQSGSGITWVADRLPMIETLAPYKGNARVVAVNAVWMHVAVADRPAAMASLRGLLAPDGVLAMSVRLGPEDPCRGIRSETRNDLACCARRAGLVVVRTRVLPDNLGRPDVSWDHVVCRS